MDLDAKKIFVRISIILIDTSLFNTSFCIFYGSLSITFLSAVPIKLKSAPKVILFISRYNIMTSSFITP